jgi:hypothetical protein
MAEKEKENRRKEDMTEKMRRTRTNETKGE